MKKNLLILATVVTILGLNCGTFPIRYDRIEKNVIRPVGLTYAPCAEGGPGDTIHAAAYFGGKPITSVMLQMSYDVLSDYNASNANIINIFDLAATRQNLSLPDSMHFDFVIPESTYYKTRAITQKTLSALKSGLPASMGSMTQRDFARFLDDLRAVNQSDPSSLQTFVRTWGAVTGVTTADAAGMASLAAIAALVSKAFSIVGVIRVNTAAADGSTITLQGEFTIRCNRDFAASFPGILPVNSNPTLRWVGIYAVKGSDRNTFRPETVSTAGQFMTTYFHYQPFPWMTSAGSDTILIDTGYSYFLAADSGMMRCTLPAGTRVPVSISGVDTVWRTLAGDSSLTDTTRDRIYYTQNGAPAYELETWFYDWEYQNMDGVPSPQDSLFMLSPGSSGGGGGENSIVHYLPPLDTRMRHIRLWVTVYDNAVGDYNRPSGFAIKSFDLYFKYSDAYVAKHIH